MVHSPECIPSYIHQLWRHCSQGIPFHELGHRKLTDLLMQMKSIVVCGKCDGTQLCVRQALNRFEASDSSHPPLCAAKDLSGCKLHKKILKVLGDHSNGAKCSDTAMEVKGFVPFLKCQADKVGIGMFLPEAVLRHCDGVKAEKIEGKNNLSLFFLDQECSSV